MTPFHFTPQGPDGITVPAGIESKAELLAGLAQAVPLPDYFGQNWDALEDCLGDLEWLDRPKLILVHQDIPLTNAPADQRTYLEILANAAKKSEKFVAVFPESCRPRLTRILTIA